MCPAANVSAINLKRILLATDLSPASLWSLPYVIAIARQYGSTIYMAHAIPLGTYVVARPQSFDAIEEEARQGAQKKLETFAEGPREQGIPVETLLAEGDVGVILPEWIKANKIDLVSVGTTGRSGVRKLVLGSTAEEIIRDADCPVITVGPAASEKSAIALRTILCAIDFSADSLRAASYALSFAACHKARLVLLHVYDGHDLRASRPSLAERLRRVISNGSNLTIDPEALIAKGNPTKKILEIAREHSADLIVIGVRGAGGLSRAASHFGSTAHEIIVGAWCPVLTVRGSQQEAR